MPNTPETIQPHRNNSFSYKVINDNITRILDNRSALNNTIQVSMPFVKATTTIALPDYLGTNAVGFTLGTHVTKEDIAAESFYANRNGEALIGYTYVGQTSQKVYVNSTRTANVTRQFLDAGTDLFSNTSFSFIPPPGIVNFSVGRNKNGLLAYGEIQFSVPILSQLEALHRTFLIPGVGMVLEWGQQFAPELSSNYDFGKRGLTSDTITDNTFPWYDRNKLIPLLERLGRNTVGLQEILNCYVYPTQGQYMWMFGRVANFTTKANSDGSFDCTVKVVGPSEDAWSYSTRNTIIPPRDNSGKICVDRSHSVESYFTSTSPGLNLKSLLEKVISGPLGQDARLLQWKKHVVKLNQGNKKGGEPTEGTAQNPQQQNNGQANTSQESFADSEDAYFLTWRFFVNVVLNDEEYGIKAIFRNALMTPEELSKISMIRPYSAPGTIGRLKYLNDPYENFVGNNMYLRSVDPSTMIIVNDTAATLASADIGTNRPNLLEDLTAATEDSRRFLGDEPRQIFGSNSDAERNSMGDFYLSTTAISTELSEPVHDKGFLSAGVWLNHKAVAQSMVSSDTIVRGVINLLDRMNSATLGFWQLALDVSEPINTNSCMETGTGQGLNYTVVDVNYKENSTYAVSNFMDRVHIFNKYIRTKNGELVGSDVIDCNVDLALPKRMFSQIATMGLVQKQDVDAINGGTDASSSGSNTPIVGDANETLRQMFSITSLSTNSPLERGPDLTIPSWAERQDLLTNISCGTVSGQSTAQTAGQGNRSTAQSARDVGRSDSDLTDQKTEAEETLNSDKCKGPCAAALATPTPGPGSPIQISAESVTYVSIYGKSVVVPISMNYGQQKPADSTVGKLYRAGYRNGRIPLSKLSLVNQGSHRLFPPVAEAFIRMQAAASAAGHPIIITDSYRPLGVQIQVINAKGYYSDEALTASQSRAKIVDGIEKRYGLGGQPGTSNHGWGLATDLDVRNHPDVLTWLTNNARQFNFKRPMEDEPWHWEYDGPLGTLEPITSPPSPTEGRTPGVTPTPTPTPSGVDCSDCLHAAQILQQTNTIIESNTRYDQGKERMVRQFPGLNKIFRYIEPYGESMTTKITRHADGNMSNAFGSSPGTLSISADITLPGISGLRIGELFWIDRIPTFYRTFGAFQTLSIEDVINKEGWTTKIHARYNFLGNSWKRAMTTQLNAALRANNAEIPASISPFEDINL